MGGSDRLHNVELPILGCDALLARKVRQSPVFGRPTLPAAWLPEIRGCESRRIAAPGISVERQQLAHCHADALQRCRQDGRVLEERD